jgi:hypothetical protein
MQEGACPASFIPDRAWRISSVPLGGRNVSPQCDQFIPKHAVDREKIAPPWLRRLGGRSCLHLSGNVSRAIHNSSTVANSPSPLPYRLLFFVDFAVCQVFGVWTGHWDGRWGWDKTRQEQRTRLVNTRRDLVNVQALCVQFPPRASKS